MAAGSNLGFSDQAARAVLADIFGFHAYRPHQEEIVRAVAEGRDVFAVMPTGGGKSLCYQLPARLLPGAAVVVSPLIALMKDQVDNARALGLEAGTLNSATPADERADTWRRLMNGRLDLLYVSPERLLSPDFLDRLAEASLSFFAIDEAHCVSEWGHDFRPDYLGLDILVERFPQKAIAAFTATATHRVADDIVARLGLRDPYLVRASFNRPNLYYQAVPRGDLEKQIQEILALYPGESGLVYRATRRKTEETAAILSSRGVVAKAYHAGMGDGERRSVQDDFRHDRCQVVAATVAFGMGIDKSNVRFVIHGDLPKNLESYYQETGRAGRDGEPAHCALFYGGQEMILWRRFAEDLPDATQREAALEQLRRMIEFTQRDDCRRRTLLAYFGEDLEEGDCGGCDLCRGEVERIEVTRPARMALSAMVRTGGRFGSRHLADLLMGADTAKIREYEHHLLPTFGVGREYDRHFWRDLLNTLVSRGLAENSGGTYPTLAVTPRCRPLLRGEESFFMLRTAVRERVRRRRADRSVSGEDVAAGLSPELLSRLKAKRQALAREAGLPPYVVFSDRSLREMAQLKPTDAEAFLEVSGVGLRKLERYGEDFLNVVAGYLEEFPAEAPLPAVRKAASGRAGEEPCSRPESRRKKRETAPKGPNTLAQTGHLLGEGHTLEEVAEMRGLTMQTVIGHLERLMAFGEVFDSKRFLPAGRLAEIEHAFIATQGEDGPWYLRPVVEGSGNDISYDEARLARLFLRPPDGTGE